MATVLSDEDRGTAERFITAVDELGISWVPTGHRGRIRTRAFLTSEDFPCCPITARYAEEMGTVVSVFIAAEHYSLSNTVRAALVDAANNSIGCDPDLRLLMVGLTEPTS